ncbi:TPA: AAC(6')-Ia family aminoglycoside 6'-N-acetyltransferase AacA56 [Pseudomonas aeruginosa]|uniref:Aminoglycoside acetyltranferase n=2 Tax=Gammaproteobacteria TaxID=1236 RepID=A0A097KUW0_PSEAI|nr:MULTISPECIES: AAC(6')-Ia family aminoglycoside 6'-N-acetyltransferase AacA56 [Gammaproteobacteria]EDO2996046.1 AAC(6')-Ia family aminoglycoside 6'-N-acetyltransferase AacA56 [Salmonella enterica]AIT97187.1 aminoglycoside acetyltranferase [Pseudomonas aeruginosa]EDO2996211.1 AAC(6')-Ia family aminoglycoside 6'-N-acetyltransferase AacA56 [Salmonella enterica]EKR6131298.1 AAC(6')-Ia family aminoglycoside 6'-N-acetyltransferase AacA56 [Salmonella enterica]EKR6131454.1 AAC(6')-Ia family aminogly
MEYKIVDIALDSKLVKVAAEILFYTFSEINNESWPTINSATEEVKECIEDKNICIGVLVEDKLVGWIGLRPMYENTWELHPMVVLSKWQGKGLGKILIFELEKRAKEQGINGIVLGTDDETFRTSLSMKELDKNDLFEEIKNIKNINHHPYEFYQKCGYKIIGVIPDANGKNKPDIWMWKKIM